LWEEGLILVYRLLFILKLEAATDPACGFSFASTGLWGNALSPNQALGPLVRARLDHGHDTRHMLEDGLRLLFRIFRDGLTCSELSVTALGGALFGAEATPLLDRLVWGDQAVAILLDRLLWTTPKGRARERVRYGSLDVEELGRVYEALLELEPGISAATMSRLRRAKLEVVLPAERAAPYRKPDAGHTQVKWVEDIPAGRFYLRAGSGRKSTGSYYTPHPFVRFLVREALAPQIENRSPEADPNPAAILALKVVDPAMGSGHFLVEACRFLGEALYTACRQCDALATTETDTSRAATLRGRVAELPDPDGLLLAYMPSRTGADGASGVAESRALAICRRLVAVHCLYGVDSNRLATELAKLSLWLESYAEGLPLTFLDHRLVTGDSTAGAFFESLVILPVSGNALDLLLADQVGERLHTTLRAALHEVRALQASVGANASNLVLKAAAKQRLDVALRPLRLLANAWSGAVMLAAREADDEWLALARTVSETGIWPAELTRRQTAMLTAGEQAVPWDLTFPEVFWRDDGGFDAVLGNPPWDMVQPNSAEFLAGFDLSILEATDRGQALAIERRLLADRQRGAKFCAYQERFVRQHRMAERLYLHQTLGASGAIMGGKLDLYRLFAERAVRLVGQNGAIGMVVPSAFHANEGATGIRQLYLQQMRLEWCLSFENRQKLFDIHARFKFALLVAHRPGPTQCVTCGFYLADFARIDQPDTHLQYDRDFITTSGGSYETLIELRNGDDLNLARLLFGTNRKFGAFAAALGIALSREIHMTDDAGSFMPIVDPQGSRGQSSGSGYLLLHEGKTIHQYSDQWDTLPRYVIKLSKLISKPQTVESAQYYRAACREVARSTDERTAIAAILPPGVVCGHTISVERKPAQRGNAGALTLVALMNSFCFDWLLRQKAAAHVSLYILNELPVPRLTPDADRCLAHASLRLCCNHAGFARLWHDQLEGAWREEAPRQSWPVIAAETGRWRLRAVIDAIVAHAYQLDRGHYQQVLNGFSHRSFPAARTLCLAAFDELVSLGMEAFCREHDPYSDIPLVTARSQPVIDLSALPAQPSPIAARFGVSSA
jgi:hypothetical protein